MAPNDRAKRKIIMFMAGPEAAYKSRKRRGPFRVRCERARQEDVVHILLHRRFHKEE